MTDYTPEEKREAIRIARLCMREVHNQQSRRLRNPFLSKHKRLLIFNLKQGIMKSIAILEQMRDEVKDG